MQQTIENIRKKALESIENAVSCDNIEEIRVEFLSRKSELNNIKKNLKDLSNEEKRIIGPLANKVTTEIETHLNEKYQALYQKELNAKLEKEHKGNVLFHHGGNDLVVRVLEHHAHGLADIVELVFVCGVHALHIHLAALRQQNGVEVLGQRGFTTAVCTQYRHELPALYLHGYAVQRIDRLLGIVAELQIFSS